MIDDEDLVRASGELEDRFGKARAARFGEELPDLVADLTERWALALEGLLPSGATSVVVRVVDRAGMPAVLKLSPDAEWVPGDTLDVPSTTLPPPQEWAVLLADLHGTPRVGVTDLLRHRCEDMFRGIGARQATERVAAHVPTDLWAWTVEECLALLDTDREEVVLHGDLHLGNVLRSDRHGLVVIGPKLCAGDRCFDMVDYVVAEGTVEEMTARALALAPLVGTDPERLLRWSRVNAVVTAISRTAWSGPDARTQTLLGLARHG